MVWMSVCPVNARAADESTLADFVSAGGGVVGVGASGLTSKGWLAISQTASSAL